MAHRTRSNGNGVDLMRYASINSNERTFWLGGGHRVSPKLPWYSGREEEPMEKEAQTLCDFICQKLLPSPFSLVLDCHSGFGYLDRIWFPYASSRIESIEHIGEVYYLRKLFQQTYPYQNYCFEQQSQHYLTLGDLWDFLYQTEVDPMQIFNQLGMFHPIKPHRLNRVLRGLPILMGFLLHATLSYVKWLDGSASQDMAKTCKGPLVQ